MARRTLKRLSVSGASVDHVSEARHHKIKRSIDHPRTPLILIFCNPLKIKIKAEEIASMAREILLRGLPSPLAILIRSSVVMSWSTLRE